MRKMARRVSRLFLGQCVEKDIILLYSILGTYLAGALSLSLSFYHTGLFNSSRWLFAGQPYPPPSDFAAHAFFA